MCSGQAQKGGPPWERRARPMTRAAGVQPFQSSAAAGLSEGVRALGGADRVPLLPCMQVGRPESETAQ